MRIGAACWVSAALIAGAGVARGQVGEVRTLAPDVYFHEGDIAKGHCNNGWVVLEDYVLVVDANFPSGARAILPKIRALSTKPIRFAFDTHHHGDHAYGNQVWVDEGAVPLAHTGVVEEMKKYETGHYGGKPGRWEQEAKEREDLRGSRLKPPSLLFPDRLIFDDGRRRVELLHLGTAHTHGDALAWLPRERILFTGDVCVNGPFNFVGDGDTLEWISVLEKARALQPLVVAPGHGPSGDATLLEDQAAFFRELRSAVKAASEGRTPDEVQAKVETLRAEILKMPRIARYVRPPGEQGYDPFAAQVAKVFNELTGKSFPDKKAEIEAQQIHFARHHGQIHTGSSAGDHQH